MIRREESWDGFWAKLLVLQAAISAGLVWLAVLAVVFSVIGALYYLRVVKYIYFDKPETGNAGEDTFAISALDTTIVISTNGLLLVALGIYPTALLSLCRVAFPQ